MKRNTSTGSLPRNSSIQQMQRTTSAERLDELIELGEQLTKQSSPVPKADDVSLTHLYV
jgi:hypothetical protein